MEILIKAAAAAIIGAVLSLVMKRDNPEMALILTVSIGCAILGIAYGLLTKAAELITNLADAAGVNSVIVAAVMKSCGIAILSKLTADICRDAGQSSAASAVEIVGAAAAIMVAGPLIKAVMDAINSFV